MKDAETGCGPGDPGNLQKAAVRSGNGTRGPLLPDSRWPLAAGRDRVRGGGEASAFCVRINLSFFV